MALTHLANITATTIRSTNPVARASFTTPLLLVNVSTSSLNGNRVVTYTSVEDAQADNTAGYLSSAMLAAVTRMFAQNPRPASVKVGYINDTGAETEAAALTAIIAADPDWYIMTYEERTAANVAALSVAIEASSKAILGVFQSADSDWKTSGVPSGYSSISSNARTAILYHDDSADWNAEGWAAARGAFNPDEVSATWNGRVRSADAYSTEPTEAERLLVLGNNANLLAQLTNSSTIRTVDSGQVLEGSPIYHIVTGDWLAARIKEDTVTAILQATDRGEKIGVDEVGAALFEGIAKSWLVRGQAIGHFDPDPDEVSAVAEAITADDRTNERIRVTVRAKLLNSARVVAFTNYLSTSSIV